MKIPKQIIYKGKTFTIEKVKMDGASFHWGSQEIKLDKSSSRERQESMLLHEILELIMVECHARLNHNVSTYSNADYLFVMNHNLFEMIVDDFYSILIQLI